MLLRTSSCLFPWNNCSKICNLLFRFFHYYSCSPGVMGLFTAYGTVRCFLKSKLESVTNSPCCVFHALCSCAGLHSGLICSNTSIKQHKAILVHDLSAKRALLQKADLLTFLCVVNIFYMYFVFSLKHLHFQK